MWYLSNLRCIMPENCSTYYSALDKLLGQLGTYAIWLSSIAYLRKQLRIFILFLRHVFFSVITHFLIAWSHRNVLAYLFTPIVCFSKVSNSRILLFLKQISSPCWHSECVYFAKFHFHVSVFPAKYWTGHQYSHKTGAYCALASKNKINTWLAFVY